jgi:hypothetical protein
VRSTIGLERRYAKSARARVEKIDIFEDAEGGGSEIERFNSKV